MTVKRVFYLSLKLSMSLQGVKGETKENEALLPATGTAIFTEENQKVLQDELEKQFTQGLRRRDGRTVGLGL